MDTKPSPFHKAIAHDFGTKYADMTQLQKCGFLAKLVLCIGTFGYAFPNVQSD